LRRHRTATGGNFLYVSTGGGGTAANKLVRIDDTSLWKRDYQFNNPRKQT